jgi:hypothetical protein
VLDVALEVPLRLLTLGRLRQGCDADLARIEVVGDRPHAPALARRVAAFDEDDHPVPGLLQPARHVVQFEPQRIHQAFVFLLLHLAHVEPPCQRIVGRVLLDPASRWNQGMKDDVRAM